jgi:cellulose synthase/poly-beta-1,6-N-acetylglucosamine synthase-like glycosyltransferase
MSILHIAVETADAIAMVALSAVIAVGIGFLFFPILYLFEWLQGKLSDVGLDNSIADTDNSPEVLVQLPIYNEPGNVIDGLLRSVAALEWPKDKLHIQLLDDSGEDAQRLANRSIEALREQSFRVEHIVRIHRQGYKAGALAAGLLTSQAPFVAILDADFRPPTNWLRIAIPRLAANPSAGFIQSRCEFSNAETNWLTRAQSLLFDSHFVMEQGVRARAGMLFQFNGTGGIWRRQAIEAAGGWTSDCLCEDLDLTIRAALTGWKGLFSMYPAVTGLVPDRMRHWRVQQRRWASGFAQIARKSIGPILWSSWTAAQKLQAVFLILYQAALPIIAVAAIALLSDVILRRGGIPPVGPLFALIMILILPVLIGMTLPPYLELKRGGIGRYLLGVTALPPLIVYLSLANARPIVAAFFGRREVFKRTPKPASEI